MNAEVASEAARLLARARWGDPRERRAIRRQELLAELDTLRALDAAEDKENDR
jgi:hypothetical protein